VGGQGHERARSEFVAMSGIHCNRFRVELSCVACFRLMQACVKPGMAIDVPGLGLHFVKSAAELTGVTSIRVNKYNKAQG
jgi:hypothetical protein